jgi:hypothetical protein
MARPIACPARPAPRRKTGGWARPRPPGRAHIQPRAATGRPGTAGDPTGSPPLCLRFQRLVPAQQPQSRRREFPARRKHTARAHDIAPTPSPASSQRFSAQRLITSGVRNARVLPTCLQGGSSPRPAWSLGASGSEIAGRDAQLRGLNPFPIDAPDARAQCPRAPRRHVNATRVAAWPPPKLKNSRSRVVISKPARSPDIPDRAHPACAARPSTFDRARETATGAKCGTSQKGAGDYRGALRPWPNDYPKCLFFVERHRFRTLPSAYGSRSLAADRLALKDANMHPSRAKAIDHSYRRVIRP